MRILSIFMGLLIAIFILGMAEVALHFVSTAHYRRHWFPKLAELPNQATHLSVRLPEIKTATFQRSSPLFLMKSWDPPQFFEDSDYGKRPLPDISIKSTMTLSDGSPFRQVTYTIDHERRRQTSGHPMREAPGIIFLGCSFTFGEGVQDHQTLPSQVALNQQGYQVYNYSFLGWGPNNLLRLVQTADFGRDLKKNSGNKAIYVFMDSHVQRAIGALSLYRLSPNAPDSYPFYVSKNDGHLNSEGMISEHRGPFLNSIFSLLAKSRLLDFFNVDLPLVTPSDFQLVSLMFEEMQKTLHDKLSADFVVIFFPGSRYSVDLIPLLDQKGIKSLDYSRIFLENYTTSAPFLPDGHPSEAAYEFLGKQILTDLNLNN